MQNYTLGPLPWSKELLRKAYFRDFITTRKAIQEHPGFQAHRHLCSLQLLFDIFVDAVFDLLESIDAFHRDAQTREFWTPSAQQRFKKRLLIIQRGIFCTSTSAMALVEQSRQTYDRFQVKQYQERVDVEFSNSEEHRFIQSLRNCICHGNIIEANWHRNFTRSGDYTQFLLDRELLLECEDWHTLAKSFIDRYPKGIDVASLFTNYRTRIEKFHEWFHAEVKQLAEPLLSEYLEYERTLNRFDANAWWKVILRQCIEKHLDPYSYLDQYLTKTELDEVLALPVRSQKQVDRIIEILDEYDACDEELRQMIYTAFGMTVSEHDTDR